MASSPYISSYQRGSAAVVFSNESDSRTPSVQISTDRLYMRSVRSSDYERYLTLFGIADKEGKEKLRKRIEEVWAKKDEGTEKTTALSVHTFENDEFVGYMGLELGGPGKLHLDYRLMPAQKDKGYEFEASAALIQEYPEEFRKKGFTINGETLRKITWEMPAEDQWRTHAKNLGMGYVCASADEGEPTSIFSLEVGPPPKSCCLIQLCKNFLRSCCCYCAIDID